MKKLAHDEIAVEVKKDFRNPLTNRMAKSGEIFNVPRSQFWLRRLEQGDCELVEAKGKGKGRSKAAEASEVKAKN